MSDKGEHPRPVIYDVRTAAPALVLVYASVLVRPNLTSLDDIKTSRATTFVKTN